LIASNGTSKGTSQASRWLAGLLAALVLGGGVRQGQAAAQDLQPGQKIDPALLEWPRFFATNGYEFAIYQPQISKWEGNQLEGRFAAAARPAGTSNETYGVVFFKARTEIDKINRLVTLEEFEVTKVDFPMEKAKQKEFLELARSLQPTAADHLEAVFAASADIAKERIEQVKNDPPRVIYTTAPSLLVLVDGPPVFRPLTGDYQRVVNTRAVLLLNTNAAYQGNYLYAAGRWYQAPSLDGPWTATSASAPGLETALAAAEATKEVDLVPARDTNAPPPLLLVYVSTVPTELIETAGIARMQSVDGTGLLAVSNTSSALFYCLEDASYYVLLSGRWFKGRSLYGPWAFVPPGQLPADFQRIPADSDKANVLASVPGTPQAREAVIANSIPQTATVERDKANLQVDYAGAPAFAPVEGTSLQYATNTATPVVMVNPTSYYACQGGVWFVSSSPTGPWAVAASVPASIYNIPVSSPIHYVTYSYVYGASPSCVYVGYTPGYMGTVVAPGDVVVYGTGYYYPPVVVGATYVGYPCSYGYGWGMALGLSVGFSFGYCCGWSSGCCYQPHWGCYGWSGCHGYNYTHVNCNATSYYAGWGAAVHTTGTYGYNPYTGTAWHTQSSATFNPYTGASSSAARGAAFNPYSGNYAAGQKGTAYNPATGAGAVARSGVAGNAYTGNKMAWNNGNVYAGKDGSIYKYSSEGGVQKYNGGSWQTVSKPAATSASQPVASSSGSSAWSQSARPNQAFPSQSTWGNSAAPAQSSWGSRGSASQSYWANHGSSAQMASAQTASGGRPAWGQAASGARATSGQTAWANHSWSAPSSAGYKGAQAQMTSPGRGTSAGTAGSSSGWGGSSGSHGSSPASSLSRESSAQALGSQRFNAWHSSGGGGWGGGGIHGGGGFRR